MFSPLQKLIDLINPYKDREFKAWVNSHLTKVTLVKQISYPDQFFGGDLDEMIKRDFVRQLAESLEEHIHIKRTDEQTSYGKTAKFEAFIYFVSEKNDDEGV
jgi:hypothetical protein